jgi:hypothetical protein
VIGEGTRLIEWTTVRVALLQNGVGIKVDMRRA